MSKKAFFLVMLLIASMVGVSMAAEFSADMVSTSKGQTMNSKVYFGTDKWRSDMEKNGSKMMSIVRMDKNVVWMVMPANKSYMEMALTTDQKVGMTQKAPGEIKRTKLGTETINGVVCDKYEVIYTGKSGTTKMFQWLSKDMIPVKSQAEDGSWAMEMKNIKMGKQPVSLFSVPAGFSKMSMPGMGSVGGAQVPVTAPKSAEDVKNMLKGKIPGF
ncbi:MAG TPA: DUF4412 domain-containing protein [Candidatus Omnitrophota bacterium]|nr:DUF4412 domain-containing protein [Candidatus Omnitrophota bacterium]